MRFLGGGKGVVAGMLLLATAQIGHSDEGQLRLDASAHINYWLMKEVPNTTHRSEPFTSAALALTLPWNNIMASVERTNTPVTDKLGKTEMEKLFLWLPVIHSNDADIGFFSSRQTYRSTLTIDAITTQIFADGSSAILYPGSQLNEPVTFKESGVFWSGQLTASGGSSAGGATWKTWISRKEYTRPYGLGGFIGEVRFTSNILGAELGIEPPRDNGWYGNASIGLGVNSQMNIGTLSVATNMAPGRSLQYGELVAHLHYLWHLRNCLWQGSQCSADVGGGYKYSDFSVRGSDPNNPGTTTFYGTLARDHFFDASVQLKVSF